MGLVPQGNKDLKRWVFWIVAAGVAGTIAAGAYTLYYIWLAAQVVFVG